jgi:hypothetical protein
MATGADFRALELLAHAQSIAADCRTIDLNCSKPPPKKDTLRKASFAMALATQLNGKIFERIRC